MWWFYIDYSFNCIQEQSINNKSNEYVLNGNYEDDILSSNKKHVIKQIKKISL